MLLYHGSAAFDAISRDGLSFDADRRNDFGDDERLASCGGIYLTDDLANAAFYSCNATCGEAYLGGDPCAFAVELPPHLIIADEDKVWPLIRNIIVGDLGWRMPCDLSAGESMEAIGDLTSKHGDDLVRRVRAAFQLTSCIGDDAVVDALRAFHLRETCYEWTVVGEAFQADLEAINDFCRVATAATSRGWMARHYARLPYSCRTFAAIAPGGCPGDARIVGSIRLVLKEFGTAVEDIHVEGIIDKADAEEFEEAYIETVFDHTGCKVVPSMGGVVPALT